MYERNKNTP